MGMITLLTDFGHRDSYVGVMKGVIATISPQSQVIDINHGIPPQAILAARFNLLTSYDYFPRDTVHLAVVDPGVGTQRTAIAVHVITPTGLRQTIVAPNNGLLTGFSIVAAVALTNSDYWHTSQPSHTFHGRDIFAPVAAHLANGVPIEQLGTSLSLSNLVNVNISNAVATERGYHSSIQHVDHFGNLVTTIPGDELTEQTWQIRCGERIVHSYSTYGHAQVGATLALIGSHGYVEIAVNGGNAAKVLGANVGDHIELLISK